MGNKLTKKERLETAKQWMQKHNVDPIDQLCKEATLSLSLSNEQAAHPSIVAMVGTNYELIPNAAGDGWMLRLAVHRRIEVWKSLAEFQYPKLRSTESKIETDTSITWVISTFPKHGSEPVRIPSTERPQLPPADVELNGERHPKDVESVS